LTKEGACALNQFATWVVEPPKCLSRNNIVRVWEPSGDSFAVGVSCILVDGEKGTILNPDIIVNFSGRRIYSICLGLVDKTSNNTFLSITITEDGEIVAISGFSDQTKDHDRDLLSNCLQRMHSVCEGYVKEQEERGEQGQP
jgi:hypothetical protein